ncbi:MULTISPECIES: T9SS type A sorting domain-containing protein [unclassified Lentimicrobium]|uniref:T9SS type A sorting domain-containing protein n=1 Tax=unclassified Lentimicrobium TaxID=2677434 RepID=UPI00155514A8|nr:MULTISPECIES: T9SS type A sorting domain-containing protein [unclassified Lentimicrobium]NPD46111.1 T9SS type A sorting domain-containing protein [Lentimicrobium sp. S6]NPD86247.1 T9SS type A sorting domain-containing protein [Lentimicrobium sp. L6]
MKNIYRLLLILLSFSVLAPVNAREHQGTNKSANHVKSTAAGCTQATSYRFLDVNNVRARINTGGDMWWDLPGGIGSQYFIPAAGTATSLFAGALWIGGLDVNGQLKLAAQKFRQDGIDYWTGPLTVDGTAAIDSETCAEYDKHFKVTREEVDLFLAWWASENKEEDFPGYAIPESFYEWPAHGDVSLNQSYYLAPFFDMDKDGDYDPENGDYPYYDVYNELCPINFKDDPNYVPAQTRESEIGIVTGGILVDQVLKGDQTLWWVFNDKGNAHTESEGAAIGLEIRGQAFAFATNDVVNNMTFYSYEIINRSTFRLTETYFSPWVDTDLGKADDDYVGCDVGRGLGYCYNGKAVDGNNEPESYGSQPPAIGVDFFQGPYLDPDQTDNPKYTYITDIVTGDTIEEVQIVDESINGVNFGNGIVDDERYGMRRFVYHNNGGAAYMSDPSSAPEYYNLLRGIWKDNTQMMYGGNAHVSSGAVGPETNFMFPGNSDPWNWGTGSLPPNGGYNQDGKYWTEEEAGNQPADRRFMQSAGPFVLESGAVNYITVGIPWARAASGGPFASVELLRVVDDKCQALFDNCFKVIDGPNAPDLTFSELDQEVIFYISNRETSNNYGEAYREKDPNINSPDTVEWDEYYSFEGYQIYQLSDASVTVEDFRDADKARLIAQYDIKNGIGRLINYEFDESLSASVPVLAVDGSDNGISHSFMLTEDAFAEGSKELVNNKQYYFSALAYAHNNFMTYTQEPGVLNGLYGQKLPYLSGRKNIKTYTVIPHRPVNGAVVNSSYGDQPQITRIEGKGNGNMIIELTDETIDEIMSRPPADSINHLGTDTYPIAYEAKYKRGYGPVDIRVVDPLNVKGGQFELRFDSMYRELNYDVTGNLAIISGGDTASMYVSGWKLKDVETGEIYRSETSIITRNEQIIGDLGFAVNLEQIYYSGPYLVGKRPDGTDQISVYDVLAPNNNVLSSEILFADSSNQWFGGQRDFDFPGTAFDWIRAGSSFAGDVGDAADDDMNGQSNPWDPNANFEGIVGGTWAPYSMTAAYNQNDYGPAFDKDSRADNPLSNISSIDFVITSDKSKWTRCPVIEMQHDRSLSEGGVERFGLRASPSIDKDGNFAELGAEPSDNEEDANYISSHGMGWFPGYAINVETGERLNIIYGENSWLSAENGRDMKWNPTASVTSNIDGSILFGGMHYVYVMRPGQFEGNQQVASMTFPAYDAGKSYRDELEAAVTSVFPMFAYSQIFSTGMWTTIPYADQNSFLNNDVKVKIRVAKPYARHYTGIPIPDTVETVYGKVNNNYPLYQFSTREDATDYGVETAYDEDMDMIRAVPNPYYAYSTYETVPLDNRIKITNLPDKCSVTIYNLAGTKIREFQKDNAVTSVEWDLKNFAGVPIAGGMYLIHVEADFNGTKKERVIKWLGMLRKSDLNTF